MTGNLSVQFDVNLKAFFNPSARYSPARQQRRERRAADGLAAGEAEHKVADEAANGAERRNCFKCK